MANVIYDYFKKALLTGSINLNGAGFLGGTADAIYCALCSNSYSPNPATDVYVSNLTNVVAPSNCLAYFPLSSPGVYYDTSLHQGILTGSNLLLATITLGTSVRGMVLFTTSPLGNGAAPLIAYLDFVTDQSVTAGTLQINFAAGGILALT